MSDNPQKAISALGTGSALGGTEVFPLIQGGITVKRPVSDFQPHNAANLDPIAALTTTAYGRSLLTKSAVCSLTTGAFDSNANLDAMYAFSLQKLTVATAVTGMFDSSHAWEGIVIATGTRSSGHLDIWVRESGATNHNKGIFCMSVDNGTKDAGGWQISTFKSYSDTLYAMLGAALSTDQTQGLIRNTNQGFNITIASTTSLSIASGVIGDSTNADILYLSAAITKTTGSWAVGSGNGGLDTGSIASATLYYVYIIKRVDTGVTDVLFSLSSSSPTMPTNYTLKVQIGYITTDGSSHFVALPINSGRTHEPFMQQYTPTFTAFGTCTSINVWWARRGNVLKLQGNFNPGTTTGSEARISLPNSVVPDPQIITALSCVGSMIASASVNSGFCLIEAGTSYITVGRADGVTQNGLVKGAGNLWNSSGTISFFCEIPISGWN